MQTDDFNDHSGFFSPEGSTAVTRHQDLCHWQQDQVFVFITWRLSDSLPGSVLESIAEERRAWIAAHPQPWSREDVIEYTEKSPKRVDFLLDQGSGSCLLKTPEAAAIAAACLDHYDDVQYSLDSYVVMPNHVHVLARLSPNHLLPTIVQAWKGVSSKRIIKRFRIEAPFWQDGYWDRLIRDATHLRRCRQYIADNPVKAKLRAGEYLLRSSGALAGH